jgi:NADH-quinone oxidoreductase subunit M
MYQRTMLGKTNGITEEMTDITWTETVAFIPLVIMIFWIGLSPRLFLDVALPDVMTVLDYVRL